MRLLKKITLIASLAALMGLFWFYVVPPVNWPVDTKDATWVDVTHETIGLTGEWSNKVEIADINHDGNPDIIFASGGDYEAPGKPEPSRVFLNAGAHKPFTEVTSQIFGDEKFLARVIKARDINQDGHIDVLIGTTYHTQSQLWMGDGSGQFTNATHYQLPQLLLSVGDLETGDVDADGDPDLVLTDWGNGNPMTNSGGVTRLWLNNGNGYFEDVTAVHMPDVRVRFSWDIELADIDNDSDLDILVACKKCEHNYVFINDGHGVFHDDSEARLPAFSNNYDFEILDLDADGKLDLFAVNARFPFAERILRNDGEGYFHTDVDALSALDNPWFCDDNVAVSIDIDADADTDILIGSLNCPDRLLINDGKGHFRMQTGVFDGEPTGGTLGLAIADLNGDRLPDVVQAQGEGAFDDRVYFGRRVAAYAVSR